MKDFRQRAFVGLIGLVSAGLLSVGCSSSSDSSGKGGGTGTGTGGTSHTGGSTGSGGGTSTGSGGSGGSGAAVNACGPAGTGTSSPPAAMLITDFSDAVPGAADAGASGSKFTFGTATTVQGGVSVFKNPMSTAGTVAVSGGALTFTATVSAAGTGQDLYPYNGFVVYINGPACTDASQYTGVSFSISGDPGMCGLVFSINDAEHGDSTTGADMRFTGPAGAYAPQLLIGSMVSSAKTTIQVPFKGAAFANGNPAYDATVGIDPKAIAGVQWQFTNTSTSTAPCTGNITVDDITFYK